MEGLDLARIRFEIIRSVSDGDAESVVVEFDIGSALDEIKGLDALADHIEAARERCDPECGLSQAAWNR